MKDFISIKEAIQLTNKSDSSIRRLIKSLNQSELVEYTKKEGKKLYLSKDMILSKLGISERIAQIDEQTERTSKELSIQSEMMNRQILIHEQEKALWIQERMELHKERQAMQKTIDKALSKLAKLASGKKKSKKRKSKKKKNKKLR